MKKIFFTVIGLIFVLNVRAQINTASRYALGALISARCYSYLPMDRYSECERSVGQMLKLSDSSILPAENGGFIFLAFKKSTIEILKSQSTTAYLNSLLKEMNSYLSNEKSHFNLWEFTLAQFSDRIEAARVLASLFQDTSHKKLHLSYLEDFNGGEVFVANKELLHQTIDTLNLLIDYRPESFQDALYPREIQKSLNRNIYHFYVPFYLSLALKNIGVSDQMAFTAPFLMTLTYEFITAANDYRYLFVGPAVLNIVNHEWKIKDIFGSYQGAGLAVGKKNLKNLEFLNTNFSISTHKTVKTLLTN